MSDTTPTLDEILEFYRHPNAVVLQDMWDRHVAECRRGCQDGEYCPYGAYIRRKRAHVQQQKEGNE